MKKNILLIAMLLSVSYSSQKKNNFEEGEVVYNVVFGDKNSKEKVSDKSKKNQDLIDKIMDYVFAEKSARLTIKFKGDKILSKPEIKPEAKTKYGFNLTQILLEKKGVYYIDLQENIVYNDKDFRGKDIVVKYKISDLKWNITNETMKTPKGNKLTKAIAKYKFEKDNGKLITREVTAWFAEDIPVRVAPLQFYGLPGLVVKIEVEGISYSLSSINSKKVNVDYKIDPKKVITEDQYMDLTNEIN